MTLTSLGTWNASRNENGIKIAGVKYAIVCKGGGVKYMSDVVKGRTNNLYDDKNPDVRKYNFYGYNITNMRYVIDAPTANLT